MKFLLKGSNLVGMEKVSLVCRILNVHGTMREHVKLVHSVVRVELNELEGDEFVCFVLCCAEKEEGETGVNYFKSFWLELL